MPATTKLLLRSGVLRSESKSEVQRAGRSPRHFSKNSKGVEGSLAGFKPPLQGDSRMYPTFVPAAFTQTPSFTAADGLWTRYGKWNAAGTKVYNNRGHVIYELP